MSVLWIWWTLLSPAWSAALSADEAVALALERSVAVVEGSAEAEGARGLASATSLVLGDPTLSGRVGAVGEVHGVSLSQPVSLSGERRARHRGAEARAEAAGAQTERARLREAARTRIAWAAAVEAQQALALSQRALQVARSLATAARARHDAGELSQLQLRLAQLQEAEAHGGWTLAVAERAERFAELSALTGLPVDGLELPDDPLDALPLPELDAQGVVGVRSDLRAAEGRAEAARAALSAERAAVLPPVQVGAFYEREGDELRIGPSLSVTVPLTGNRDGRAVARGELAVAERVAEQRARRVAAEQGAARQALELLEVDRPHDPRDDAEAAFASIEAGVARGELDLVQAGLLRRQVVDGQRAWLTARRVRSEARVRAALAHDRPELLAD
jgi:cobalt-zinc-cadmium efflux system outer membrane protein